jgi:hypothetical protein
MARRLWSEIIIATPREALASCRSDATLAEVMARNHDGFDYFPVIDADQPEREQVIGLVELVPYLRGKKPEGVVNEHLWRLCEDNLIGADAGILTFVKAADQYPCRLVMSGTEISGLVSLSDLQQLPVRAALFALITHIEMTMADAIRRDCDGSDRWKRRLSKDRLDKVESKQKATIAADNDVDELLLTQFCDKTTIIRKSERFTESKGKFEHEMNEAQELRDNLAHANEYAATREEAAKVCDTVRKIEQWIALLSQWPSPQVATKD